MNARTLDARWSYLIPGALVATILTGVRPHLASAQHVAGSLGVALTVLPVAPQALTITGFHVDRDGSATIRASVPTRSAASPLVMTRVSGLVGGFAPMRALPVVVRRSSATDIAARDVAYRIEFGRAADGAAPRDVQLRLECLIVAGT